MAHLCGLCLTLRDRHGHLARLVTNYDGLLVSVLVEAQAPELSPHRTAAPCALRGFARADVVDARAEGARLAAAASLALAAGKIGDHLTDRDGIYARPLVGAAARRVAERWSRASEREAASLGFDDAVLRDALRRQPLLEARGGLTLLELTEPTETAVSAVFARTGELAGKPHNVPALAEAGPVLRPPRPPARRGQGPRGRPPHGPSTRSSRPAPRWKGGGSATTPPTASSSPSPTSTWSAAGWCGRAGGQGTAGRGATPSTSTGRPPSSRPARCPRCATSSSVCQAELCKSCTCGCYQPPWSPKPGKSCRERCECDCGAASPAAIASKVLVLPSDSCDCCRWCCKRCVCDCCDCGDPGRRRGEETRASGTGPRTDQTGQGDERGTASFAITRPRR